MRHFRHLLKVGLLAAAIFVCFQSVKPEQANAQVRVGVNFWTGTYSGFPFGYGYYRIVNRAWPVNFVRYGYSFFPHFNHAPFYAQYASISFSPSTGRVGRSWQQPNLYRAELVANSWCGVADCQSVVWVRGGCASLIYSDDAANVFWGYGHTLYASASAARRACSSTGASDCRAIYAQVCSQ